MAAPSAEELQQLLVDAAAGNSATQASVTSRLEHLHALPPQPKADVVSHFVAALGDSNLPATARRLAGTIARQLLQGKNRDEAESAAACSKSSTNISNF